MKIWFDTEFIEDGKTIDLMSIGAIREDGKQYYAEVIECDLSRASPWVRDNVIPHLRGGIDRLMRADIALDLIEFMGEKPEIWAYYADYDWVALCQLFGTMMDLPKGWPMYCRDVKQLCDSIGNPKLPEQTNQEHNALMDAVWTKGAWDFLMTDDSRASRGGALNQSTPLVDGKMREGEVVWLREIDAGTDSACWVISNRVDPGAVPFFQGIDFPRRHSPQANAGSGNAS